MPPKRKQPHSQPPGPPDPPIAAAAAAAAQPTETETRRRGRGRPPKARRTETTAASPKAPSPPQTPPPPHQSSLAKTSRLTAAHSVQALAQLSPASRITNPPPPTSPQPHRSPNPPPPSLPPHWAGPATAAPAKTSTAKTTKTPSATNTTTPTTTAMGSIANLPPPSGLVAPEISYHIPHQTGSYQPQHQTPTGRYSPLVRPHGPPGQLPSIPMAHRPPPAVVTPIPPPKPPQTAMTAAAATKAKKPNFKPTGVDRNIDKVALGDLMFKTWYPSYYGKEILGDLSAGPSSNRATTTGLSGVAPTASDGTGGKASHTNPKKDKEKEHKEPQLDRLYVCPSCFKYSKEIVAWLGHVRACERRGTIPGRKIYVHPQGRRKVLIPQVAKGPAPKRRRADSGVRYVEETIQDEGEWSIWEVDGEKEGLYCQNLSLFAKLWLDNKSVFFDVTGFNYYLLVYTPPPTPPQSPNQEPPRPPQVTGFFSKEKMSWDNNNLACILVFPPWQRKGLGALLMGASYEISRREGILGGPEKPISVLGKIGYKRFWAGEIARWLLSLDVDGGDGNEATTIVDVQDCSQATWICLEDCLAVLRDMGIVEDAGLGPGKPVKLAVADGTETQEAPPNPTAQPDTQGDAGTAPDGTNPVKEVPRVKIDKAAVLRYVANYRIGLELHCDPDGFVEGYAVKSAPSSSRGDDEMTEV